MAQVTIIEAVKSENSIFKKRCAAYCRVSTEIGRQKNSYSAQVDHYTKQFENSQTEILVDIYADEGISGTGEDKRSEFKRMISDCRKGKIDRIYTKSISRFARNTRDCLKNIRELRTLGISIYFEKEDIDTALISDEIMKTVMGGLAQEESTSIGQNVAWGIRKKMQNGTMKYANAPYGYKKIPESGDIEIDSEKAGTVRMIFDMYLNGFGCRKIAEKLNELNIAPPAGKMWRQNRIGEMLSNESYIGNALWQKWYYAGIPTKRIKNRGEYDMYRITGDHEAIVSKDIFEKAQLILESHRKLRSSPKERIFSKIMICGCCGSKYSYRKNQSGERWDCIQRSNYPGSCNGITLSQMSIENTFIVLCNKLRRSYKDILVPARRTIYELKLRRFSNNNKALDIHREIADLKEQRHVISVMRGKGFLSEEKFQEQAAMLDTKLMKANQSLRKHNGSYDEDNTVE